MVKMGTVWDRTAEFLSDNLGAVLPVALLAFFVPASISSNLEAVIAGASIPLALGLRLVELLLAIVSIWGSLAIVAMALDGGEEASPAAIARRRLPAALAVSVVLGLAAGALVLPIPLFLYATGHDLMAIAQGRQIEISRFAAWTVAIYSLVLLLAMLWLGARLFVINPAIVRERLVFGAVARSWSLTRGSAVRIVGVMILFAVVGAVARLAAGTVFGSIFALVAGNDAEGISLAGVLTSIVTAAVQTAFMVLFPAFEAKLYLALAAQAPLRDGTIRA
jgi:hypothetical protein